MHPYLHLITLKEFIEKLENFGVQKLEFPEGFHANFSANILTG